ncbi:T9SS type A sorting domain-containing protein [candidate division KSB1 bacterium]|nr:T9SS type A sorting domain-containing protein [candidate division KSB1 bacterium]
MAEPGDVDLDSPWRRPHCWGVLEVIGGPTAVESNIASVPGEFKVYDNYPNPFNPVTTIQYDIPKNSMVQLKVFDILGREVATLVNRKQAAGSYSINFDASNLANGIYIYKITADNYSSTKKMMLLK